MPVVTTFGWYHLWKHLGASDQGLIERAERRDIEEPPIPGDSA